jgi:hypothetical protein
MKFADNIVTLLKMHIKQVTRQRKGGLIICSQITEFHGWENHFARRGTWTRVWNGDFKRGG